MSAWTGAVPRRRGRRGRASVEGRGVSRLLIQRQVILLQGRNLLAQRRDGVVRLGQLLLELGVALLESIPLGRHHGEDAGSAAHSSSTVTASHRIGRGQRAVHRVEARDDGRRGRGPESPTARERRMRVARDVGRGDGHAGRRQRRRGLLLNLEQVILQLGAQVARLFQLARRAGQFRL